MEDRPVPPAAAVRPHRLPSPFGERVDPYYWLRDDSRSDPQVLAHLAAENSYRRAILAPLVPLEERIYAEIVGRIAADDTSVPYRDRGHWYYRRYSAGHEYPVYLRRTGSLEAPEQVLLDVNTLAADGDYYALGAVEVSPDGRLLAYTADTVGRRQYRLQFRIIATGETLSDAIDDIEADVVWAGDGRSVLYIEKDPQTLLGCRVRRHVLGTPVSADVLVYEEEDDGFYIGLDVTKDHRYLLIECSSTVTSEWRYAAAEDPELRFQPVLPREREHEYEVDHVAGRWILRSNRDAPNFRLLEAPVGAATDASTWRELLAHRADAFIEGFDVFNDFIAIEERSDGLAKLRIRDWSGSRDVYVESDEPAYAITLGTNLEIGSALVRYTYDSLTTPTSTFDYSVVDGRRTLLKREPVLGGYDPREYVTERVYADARDGARVPVVLVYRKGTRRDGTAPLLLSAYGAYGICSDPHFAASDVSLLDRGVVHAIAQVRGGQEFGRAWYDAGRLLQKRNSFNDFIDVTRHLVAAGYADPARVVARGGSAGGLLVGAVANIAPELYRAVVAHVPFVDVVTSMMDVSLPLTTNEYDEWGDPGEKPYYDYMLAYSPYDQVARQDYPAMFVTSGLWDSQVQYFEPAKWVVKLRAMNTGDRPVLLRIDLDSGHGGKSGRYRRYREIAEEYAFVLWQVGREEG